MSHSGAAPSQHSSPSDIHEIQNLISSSVQHGPAAVLPPAPQPSPSLPSPSSPPVFPRCPHPTGSLCCLPRPPSGIPSSSCQGIAADGFGPPPNMLTGPVWDNVKRDLTRIVTDVKLLVLPNPNWEDPGKALRDWDLCGPFFIVFLGIILSWSASVRKVFAVAFAVLAAGAIIPTLNVLLLGGHIIFFQSISLLGYCLFPLVVGALICLLGIQRHHQDDGGVGNTVMVFLGCVSFHEHCCVPMMKSLGPVLSFSFAYLLVGFLIMAIG